MDNIKEWTSLPIPELLTRVSCRKDWKRISAESSLMSPSCPQYVKGLNGTEQTVKTKAYEWEKKIIKKTAGFEREREKERD